MKQVLLKTIVIVVGKLIKSRVLRDGMGLCEAPRGGDEVKKNFLSCGAGRGGAGRDWNGVRQNHMGWGQRP